MTMTEWANNEIELFKERASEGDKGHAEAAASAFRSLMGDDHTGMSIGIAGGLINALVDAKEEDPGKWAEERKAEEKASETEADGKMFIMLACIEYACTCIDSAAKAYEAMLKVEKPVSGRAKELLNRLLKGQPLSPITEEDFQSGGPSGEWEVEPNVLQDKHLKSSVQCPRMFSLFREEGLDGSVSYSDVNRAVYMDQRGQAWADGEAIRTVDRMFPIALPYYPADEPFVVHGCDCCMEGDADRPEGRDGTADAICYDYLITPEGKRIELNVETGGREEGNAAH